MRGMALIMLAFACFGGSATASETVFGGGLAKDCQTAAESAAKRMAVPPAAVTACDLAISSQAMSLHDLAATLVNRGILYLVEPNYGLAQADFDAAIATLPTLGGAYVNLGAALIAQNQFAEGITQIDRGLALNAPEPEKAYFNRGLARERMGDIKGAYADLKTAARLKPDWAAPREELTRFRIKLRP